jgi:hypothetical protein
MSLFKILFFVLIVSWSQSSGDFRLVETIPAKADNFEIDVLGNIYLIDASRLIKLNPQGEKLHEYSNPMLGDITSLDVSDPLRLLVFYRESNQIEFLNNALAEIASPIVFDDYEIYSAQVVCSSSLNRIWVFDNENRQLIQYDKNMGVVQKSPTVDQIIESGCIPDLLFESQNHIYLNCPEYGILVFDQFGSFVRKFPNKGIQSFSVDRGDFYYQRETDFFRYSKLKIMEDKLPLPYSDKPMLIKWRNGKFYVLSEKRISVFELIG